MRLEFTGQSSRDSDNPQANSSRLVNCYREIVQTGGKSQFSIKSVLGLTTFAQMTGVFIRALEEVGGFLYAAVGGSFYKISSNGSVTNLGAATDGAQATISGNNGDVTLVIDGQYWLWDGATLSNPTAGAFTSFGSVDYLGNYTMLTELDGIRFQWSDVADASTLPGLNFSSADGRDDKIVRGMTIGGVYYVFKETSHEIWYQTGEAGASAFDRQVGGVIDVGLKAHDLIAKIPGGGAFFVGSDGKVRVIGIPQPISIPPVETAIQGCEPTHCLTYEDEGHTFCAIIFRDCPAWVFDLSSGEWHERAQGATLDPWGAAVSAKLGNAWYVGRSGGEILTFGRTNTDAGIPLVRVLRSRTLSGDGKRFTVSLVELFAKIGYAAATVEMFVSKDNGNTWGDPKPRAWAVGEYGKRLVWRALGQFRQITVEFRMSDPVDVPINAEGMIDVA